jgi:hypothetical protein
MSTEKSSRSVVDPDHLGVHVRPSQLPSVDLDHAVRSAREPRRRGGRAAGFSAATIRRIASARRGSLVDLVAVAMKSF